MSVQKHLNDAQPAVSAKPALKMTVAYLKDFLGNMSSTENIGASDDLSGFTKSVFTEIVYEEDEPVEAFDFGTVHIKQTKALHLDEFDVPVILYEMQFIDLGVALAIEARRSSMWYYYPGGLTAIADTPSA